MQYRALFLDIDGTTVPNRADGMPSLKVREAIHKAKKKIYVCLATSRPLFMAKPIIDTLDIRGLCVINDATQIYDPVNKKIIQSIYLDQHDAPHIVKIFRSHNLPIILNDGKEEDTYVGNDLPNNICALVVANVTEAAADRLTEDLSKIPSVAVHKIFSYSKNLFWISVTHATATKLHGIVTIAEMLGVKPEEMIGIGDGYNDYPLLSASGLKVAMGNAAPELKAIADFIAPSVEEDGVAKVIEKFILNK